MKYKIKNWAKLQHFKDRTPPWIKLYREILDDPDWHELDGDAAKVLISLWLIASEDETRTGLLPDNRKIAFRLRIKESQLNQYLTKLNHWLIQDDINVISDVYQLDAPETETEGETETKKEAEAAIALPSFVDQELWNSWVQGRKGKKITTLAAKTAIGQLVEWNTKGLDANSALRKAVIGGHQGLYEPDQRSKKNGIKPVEDWFIPAGFDNVHEARNAGCSPSTVHMFHDGKKLEAA